MTGWRASRAERPPVSYGRGVKDALIVSLLSVVPRKTGARTMGWFARSGASGLVTRAFVAAYGVNLDEATG